MSNTYKSITTETLNPVSETLVVTRFGDMDSEWYDRVYAVKRRAALQAFVASLLPGLHKYTILAGKGLIYAFTHELRTTPSTVA